MTTKKVVSSQLLVVSEKNETIPVYARKNYRDLIVWQRSMDLAKKVYKFTARFPKEETYGLTQQARRAAVSVPANIAEGQGRNGRKEFIQFLGIAFGSLSELETHLILAEKLELVRNADVSELLKDCDEIGKMLNGLLKSLQLTTNN